METTLTLTAVPDPARPSSVRDVYLAHGEFVWLTLQRMGIRDADLEDVAQEVYLVVHRRLGRFDGSSRVTTWLFGICLRVVANHRRRAYVRRERPVAVVAEPDVASEHDVEDRVALSRARGRLEQVLAALTPVQRAVLVMFEVDEMSCEAIAQCVGVPVGTVYSRLHAARRAFAAAVAAPVGSGGRS